MFKSGHFISVLAAFTALTGCSPEIQLDDVLVLGHGGSGFYAIQNHHPPNSQKSIELALFLHGADGVEVDVQLTADNQIVLYHDQRLETSTNETGYISDWQSTDLSTVLYRGQVDALSKEPLYLLKDLLSILKEIPGKPWLSLNMHTQLEVDDQEAYRSRFVEALKEALMSIAGDVQLIIESPDREMLQAIVTAPWVPLADIYFDGSASDDNINFAQNLGLKGLVSNYLSENLNSMQKAKEANLRMVLYGLKIRLDIRRALELKPYMVQTDNVPLTFDLLGD